MPNPPSTRDLYEGWTGAGPGGFGMGGLTTPGGTGGVSTPVSSPAVSAGVPSNLSSITNLINSLNLTAQQAANAARIPGATGLEEQSSLNIGSQLRGELPADVVRNLQQQAAERGVGGGFAGAPNETAAYLRALGLTTLDLQNMGQENLTRALGRNSAAPLFDPSTMVLNPYQAGMLTNQGRQLDLQAAEVASQNALRQAQTEHVGQGDVPWYINTPQTTTTTKIPYGSVEWAQIYGGL